MTASIPTGLPVEMSLAEEELITYVARNLEPYRGFHVFMRAIPEIQKRRPKARIVIVGGDEVSYSPRLPPGPDLPPAPAARDRGQSRSFARALHRPHSVRRLPGAAAPLVGARLPDVSIRAVVVAARGHVGRLPGGRLAHAAGGGGDPRRRERPAHRFLLDRSSWPQRIDEALSRRPPASSASAARKTVVERFDLKRVCLPAQLELAARLQRQGADARPAADVKHLAGDETVLPVGEEEHRPGHVARLS